MFRHVPTCACFPYIVCVISKDIHAHQAFLRYSHQDYAQRAHISHLLREADTTRKLLYKQINPTHKVTHTSIEHSTSTYTTKKRRNSDNTTTRVKE